MTMRVLKILFISFVTGLMIGWIWGFLEGLVQLSVYFIGILSRTGTLPTFSIVDIVVSVEKSGVSVTEVNDALKAAAEGELSGILGYCDLPLVSTDFNGSALSSIVDAQTTYVVDNMVKVLSWYDNEAGYSHRMVDLAALVGGSL